MKKKKKRKSISKKVSNSTFSKQVSGEFMDILLKKFQKDKEKFKKE